MKKLKILLIPLFFSSLLAGCGMKGPLYRAPETQTIENKSNIPEIKVEEQSTEQDKNVHQ